MGRSILEQIVTEHRQADVGLCSGRIVCGVVFTDIVNNTDTWVGVCLE